MPKCRKLMGEGAPKVSSTREKKALKKAINIIVEVLKNCL
jgi:hypothetical protein